MKKLHDIWWIKCLKIYDNLRESPSNTGSGVCKFALCRHGSECWWAEGWDITHLRVLGSEVIAHQGGGFGRFDFI